MRARRLVSRGAAVVSAVVLATAGLAFAVSLSAGAATVEKSFEEDGEHSWVVPAGVCSVWVDAFGAQGGDAIDDNEGVPTVVAGGEGGRATARIAVTPGEKLEVNVGGAGEDGQLNVPGAGGTNGGGDGGLASDEESAGGGGGGASDVRQGGDEHEHRVVVAGGGGGAGGGTQTDLGVAGGRGGDGGGEEGDDGEAGGGVAPVDPAQAGEGGSQDEAGDGGVNTALATVDGEDGEQGEGGDGGGVTDAPEESSGGGGGGGGWFGGGGGAGGFEFADANDDAGLENGAGGGGGSGFGPEGVDFETGEQEGDGEVTISYDPVSDACTGPEAIEVEPTFTG